MSLRHEGAVNMMKGAIVSADAVTTVSETYAKEIRFSYFGEGFRNFCAAMGISYRESSMELMTCSGIRRTIAGFLRRFPRILWSKKGQ